MFGFKRSILVSLWFMFLTFPIMVIRVNTVEDTINWRFENMLYVGVGAFVLSFVWRYFMQRKEQGGSQPGPGEGQTPVAQRILGDKRIFYPIVAAVVILAITFPTLFGAYRTNVMISTLLYIMLGLGLNIVVGLAGLLDLGFVAFYAVGAYAYALLNQYYGLGFWTVLPLGGLLGALCGILLGYPVLRLRGDYLAIVTLGFGEIIRLVLENWGEVTHGPSGVSNIPRPSLFGADLSIQETAVYIYYIVLAMVLLTIFVVNRLKNSRIGRAWLALKEDEIACQAMGVDKAKTKLMAFSLGATWAGFAGVIFAAKTTFINPACFTFLESALILSIVVLGGMGSITGVIVGALVIVVLPETLRDFPQFRMLLFGAILVIMMVFRPQGLISTERKKYEYHGPEEQAGSGGP
ncbi:MAG: high-affinity branched-chain amino acid ABC transporter permease LivM [Desulfovibrionaceae bacterium]